MRGLVIGRDTVVALNRARPRVIGGQRQTPIAETIIHHAQIPRAAIKVLMRVIGVYTQICGGLGHQLRQATRPRRRNGTGIPAALLIDQTKEQINRDAMTLSGGTRR